VAVAEVKENLRPVSWHMQNPISASLWVKAGVLFLVPALFLQNVTVANQSYREVLIAALIQTAVADVCFFRALLRGGVVMQCFCVLLLLPTLFVVADFIRRAPGAFR
jgi:hypothetical protein